MVLISINLIFIKVIKMVLVYQEIKEAIESGKIGCKPYDQSLIQPNSLDMRLGDEFILFHDDDDADLIDPYDYKIDKSSKLIQDRIIIYPYDFMLATTKEYIALPDNICAEVNGKSSLARLGLSIHQTGGWVDCGFEGQITLEIYNCNQKPIMLYENMAIAQLVFHETTKCDLPYNKKSDAKYNGQVGVVPSRYYKNGDFNVRD